MVNLINQALDEQKNNIIQFVEEKFEHRLAEEFSKIRVEMAEMRAESKSEMAEMKSSLIAEIQSTRSEMIKWMFVFWVGQIAVLVGLLFAFFK